MMVDWNGCKMVDLMDRMMVELMGKLTVGKKVDMMVEWMVG